MAGTSQHSPLDSTWAPEEEQPLGGWATGILFGGSLAVLVGVFQVFEGVVALVDEGYLRVRPDGPLLDVGYPVWGWVHIVVGVVTAVVGVGVLAGNAVARVVGVVVAWVSAVAHMFFVPAAPAWALFVIAVDVLVIYALVVHGGDLRPRRAGAASS